MQVNQLVRLLKKYDQDMEVRFMLDTPSEAEIMDGTLTKVEQSQDVLEYEDRIEATVATLDLIIEQD